MVDTGNTYTDSVFVTKRECKMKNRYRIGVQNRYKLHATHSISGTVKWIWIAKTRCFTLQ